MKLKLTSLLLLLCSFGFSQQLLLENVNVVDVTSGKIIPNQFILVQNGIISQIDDISKKPMLEMPTLDVAGKYVMPGMIDSHIHFFQTGSIYTRPDALNMTDVKPYEEELQFAEDMVADSFERYLRLGITTIIDVGGPFSNFKVRDSIAAFTRAPNVLVTGPLFSPYQPEALSQLDDVPIVKITNVAEATALFNKMLPYEPDFIKIWYIANNEIPAEKTYPIVAHIAKMAHKNGLKLAVHATQKNTAELAIKAGADILVHSIDDAPATQEFAKLLVDNNVTYIPTLLVSKNYLKSFLSKPDNHPSDLYFANPDTYGSMTYFQQYSPENVPSSVKRFWDNEAGMNSYFDETGERMRQSLKLLQKEGVNIATGTDAGNIGTMHASSYIQELEAMQKAGLTPAEIIKASTRNAAIGFGLDAALGTVAVGKKADLVVLDKNPLENLQHLTTITEVLKDGIILGVDTLISETPAQLVQRQVNAYNARDIKAFLDTYADDIEIYNFPEQPSLKGKAQLRSQFSQLFERVPNLYCKIENRIVLGNKVVDREHVRFGENYSDVIAIYEVNDGKISKVTFLR